MQKRTRQLTLGAMFVALSVLFPMLFHAVGLGATFLPMFWPVATAAFFLNPPLALGVAVLAPLLSSLMTGMPPVTPPILHIVLTQLVFMNATIVMLRRRQLGAVWSVFLGLFISQIVLFFVVMVLAPILGLPGKLFSIAMVFQGLPGAAAILICVPIFVSRIKHEPLFALR